MNAHAPSSSPSHHKAIKKKPSPKTKLQQQPSRGSVSSKFLVFFLMSLIVATIVIDTYILWPREHSMLSLTSRRQVVRPSGLGYGEVSQLQRLQRQVSQLLVAQPTPQRRHTFPNPENLPKLIPKNRQFNEEEGAAAVSVTKQEPKSSSSSLVGDDFDRAPILKVFEQAGIPPLNASMIATLPTWSQIVKVIGSHPVIGGLDTCEAYKQKVPAVERMLGSSGMFNTG